MSDESKMNGESGNNDESKPKRVAGHTRNPVTKTTSFSQSSIPAHLPQTSIPPTFVPGAQKPLPLGDSANATPINNETGPLKVAPHLRIVRRSTGRVPTMRDIEESTKALQESKEGKQPMSVRKRILLAVILIFAIIIGWGVFQYISLVSSIQRTSVLSDMPDDSTGATVTLISGSDARSQEAIESGVIGERSDTIMLLIQPKSGPASLISIPRDTYVDIPAFKDRKMLFGLDPNEEIVDVAGKINASFSYGGAPLLVRTVEELTLLKVDHYAEIGFDGLPAVVDAAGGLNLCYKKNVNDKRSGMVWKKGCHDVDGATTLAFSRMRYKDPQGDIGRASRQRQVITKLSAKIRKVATEDGKFYNLWNIGKLLKIVHSGLDNVVFDSKTGVFELVRLASTAQEATSKKGVTGTPPIINSDFMTLYGESVVQIDDSVIFWNRLALGECKPGETVGGID